MKQEVRSSCTFKKKLFEWDRSTRLIRLKLKKEEYIIKLTEDNTFVCISKTDEPSRTVTM